MKKVIVAGLVFVLALSVSAFAGMNAGAVGAIHVEACNAKRSCTKYMPAFNSCYEIITTYPGTDVHFFPVFWDPGDGYIQCTAIEYGIMLDGVIVTFVSCSDSTIFLPDYIVRHLYFGCRTFRFCIPAFGWADCSGYISLTHAYITDWNGEVDTVRTFYKAGTNGFIGDDPTGSSAVEQSTWGSIKAMFK